MRISILGDSISTYASYSRNVISPDPWSNYYPGETDVDDVTKTWWWETIRQLNGTFLSNDSIGGTCVAAYTNINDDSSHLGPKWCMNNQNRINDLCNTLNGQTINPELIMFFGGFNDCCQSNDNFDIDLFVNSYSNVIRMMFEKYSNSITILCITPYNCGLVNDKGNYNQVCSGIATVVNHYRSYGYDCKLVSLMDINLSINNGTADGLDHPTPTGMRHIADRVAYVQQYGYQ